jgi:hypothetical protein
MIGHDVNAGLFHIIKLEITYSRSFVLHAIACRPQDDGRKVYYPYAVLRMTGGRCAIAYPPQDDGEEKYAITEHPQWPP